MTLATCWHRFGRNRTSMLSLVLCISKKKWKVSCLGSSPSNWEAHGSCFMLETFTQSWRLWCLHQAAILITVEIWEWSLKSYSVSICGLILPIAALPPVVVSDWLVEAHICGSCNMRSGLRHYNPGTRKIKWKTLRKFYTRVYIRMWNTKSIFLDLK